KITIAKIGLVKRVAVPEVITVVIKAYSSLGVQSFMNFGGITGKKEMLVGVYTVNTLGGVFNALVVSIVADERIGLLPFKSKVKLPVKVLLRDRREFKVSAGTTSFFLP